MPKINFNIGAIFRKIDIFLKEVRSEIKKVNWLTVKETIRYTLIVLGVSVVTAVFLGGIDYLFTNFLNTFII